MTLVLRNIKNAELTWTELDGNFTYLENKINEVEEQIVSADIVRVVLQDFLPAQQNQARANIGAASAIELDELEGRVEQLEALEYVSFNPQEVTDTQRQQVLNNLGLRYKQFIYVTTPADALQTTSIDILLPEVPNFITTLHVGSGFVNENRYTRVNDVVTFLINPTYPLQPNKEITLSYFY